MTILPIFSLSNMTDTKTWRTHGHRDTDTQTRTSENTSPIHSKRVVRTSKQFVHSRRSAILNMKLHHSTRSRLCPTFIPKTQSGVFMLRHSRVSELLPAVRRALATGPRLPCWLLNGTKMFGWIMDGEVEWWYWFNIAGLQFTTTHTPVAEACPAIFPCHWEITMSITPPPCQRGTPTTPKMLIWHPFPVRSFVRSSSGLWRWENLHFLLFPS